MKLSFFLYILSSIFFTIDAQNASYREYLGVINGLHQYSTASTPFPNDLVADDFGPRELTGDPYDWHGGIDFNAPDPDVGDLVLAIEGGTVHTSGINTGGFKWISIVGAHNTCYEHVVDNGVIGSGLSVGGCIVKHLDITPNDSRNDWAIIFRINGVYTAICPLHNQNVTFNDELGVKRTIVADNVVAAGQPIAPLGGSGHQPNGSPYPPHAHIQGMTILSSTSGGNTTILIPPNYDQYAKNPLEYVTHTSPNISIDLTQQNLASGISPIYSTPFCTPLKARVTLVGETNGSRYINSIVDVEKAEFKITKAGQEDWSNIKGPFTDRIQYGGTIATSTIPVNIRTQGVGSWTLTGIAPHTYFTHNYDDFYFADFYARIHKNDPMNGTVKLTSYPWDARYVDGSYTVKTAITNANDVYPEEHNWSVGSSFKIDNFKPFIRSVGIYSGSGLPSDPQIYYREWISKGMPDGSLRLAGKTSKGPASLIEQVVTVYATASEPLLNIKAKIPDLANATNWVNGTVVQGTDNKKWSFQFSSIYFTLYACYSLVFEGEDLYGNSPGQGNKLLILPTFACADLPNNSTFVVPYRTGPATWSDSRAQGQDQVHLFKINCGHPFQSHPSETDDLPVTCITSDDVNYAITYSTPQANTGAVDLTINGGTSGMSFTWTNASGQVVGHTEDLANVPAGVYCIEILLDCCAFSDCIEVKNCGISLTPTIKLPAPGASNGSVSLTVNNGTEPYQFHWNNGFTTNSISGLAPGTYSVTVEDAYHCTTLQSFTLLSCPVIQVSINPILKAPESCYANNGEIKLTTGPTVSGGLAPYTFHWEDANGNQLVELINLSPGKYCIIAMDANGCTGSQWFDLRPAHFPELTPFINPTCVNTENGQLAVFADDPEIGTYDFLWEDGSGDFDVNYTERTNLAAGTYCITITSTLTDCSIQKCFEVLSLEPTLSLQVASTVVNPCPGANNGNINLTTTGGIAPYLYSWSGVLSDKEDLNGLGAGNYVVTVTDYCGTAVVKSFQLKALAVNLSATPGCKSQGQASLTATFGNSPYSYNWSNGALTLALSNLNSGNYCVTVRDAAGCQVNQCIDLQNKEFTVTNTNPCAGMSDGVITLHIMNPTSKEVIIALDGNMIFQEAHAASVFNYNIPSLNGNNTVYNISVTIDGCNYNKAVTLENNTVTSVYDHYDQVCYYTDWCNGVEIPNSTSIRQPYYGVDNGSGGWLSECSIPVFCGGGGHVDDEHVKKETVRAAQYYAILVQAYDYFPNQAIVDQRIEAFYNLGVVDCDKIRYCPANLKVTSVSHTPGVAGTVRHIENSPGCYSLHCGLFGENDESFCTKAILPPLFSHLQSAGVIVEACEPASQNLAQLQQWKTQMAEQYGDLLTESDLWKNYIMKYEDDPRAFCANIVFCTSNFSVLFAPDMETINCDDPIINCNAINWMDGGAGPCFPHACIDDNFGEIINVENDGYVVQFLGHLEIICDEYPGHFFGSGHQDEMKIISSPSDGGRILNFGTAISDGVRASKGIFQYGTKTKFYDYTSSAKNDLSEEVENLEYFVDDWDTDQIVLVRKIEDLKRYVVEFQNDALPLQWSRLIQSNNYVKIRYFDKEAAGQFVIAGEFNGNLSFENTQIANESSMTGFLIRIDGSGNLISLSTVRNLDPTTPPMFAKGDGGVYLVGKTTNQPIVLDGNSVNSVQSGRAVRVLLKPNQNTVDANTFTFSPTLSLIKMVRSADGNAITYLLKGAGNVVAGQATIVSDYSKNLLLYTTDSNGNLLWKKTIDGHYLVENKMDIAYGSNQNLLIGLTFLQGFAMGNNLVANAGGNDIAFFTFDVTGSEVNRQIFGSVGDENISKLVFTDNVFYFGGEFGGPTTNRQIGGHRFYPLTNVLSNPYMSFLLEGTGNNQLTQPEQDRHAQTSNPDYSVSVYPNPFDDKLMVNIQSSTVEEYTIRVFNSQGRMEREMTVASASGTNQFGIEGIGKAQPGIYFIHVFNNRGMAWKQKVVKY